MKLWSHLVTKCAIKNTQWLNSPHILLFPLQIIQQNFQSIKGNMKQFKLKALFEEILLNYPKSVSSWKTREKRVNELLNLFRLNRAHSVFVLHFDFIDRHESLSPKLSVEDFKLAQLSSSSNALQSKYALRSTSNINTRSLISTGSQNVSVRLESMQLF